MKELIIRVRNGQELTDAEILEKEHKKVRVGEYVKFRGKAYVRVIPRRNKYFKQTLHFSLLSEDIYSGAYRLIDSDGEEVNVACHYRATLVEITPEPEELKKK